MLESALQFAAHNVPIFPVRLRWDGTRWLKEPHIKQWQHRASADPRQVEEWWWQWPNALPGIALARTRWVVVDCDRHGGPDGVAAFQELGPMLPHPIVTTPSTGKHHFFAQPNPPITSSNAFKHLGIDILGTSRFVVGYDLAPLVAQAAPELPEVFRAIRRPHPSAGQAISEIKTPTHGTLMSEGGDYRIPKPLYHKMQRLLSPNITLHNQRRIQGILRFLLRLRSGRNAAINNSAFALREFIPSGLSSEAAAELLFTVSELNGYVAKDGAKAAWATIRSGLGISSDISAPCVVFHKQERGEFTVLIKLEAEDQPTKSVNRQYR
jgi:Bifunctional DNA primase/polymerase, N-terminal